MSTKNTLVKNTFFLYALTFSNYFLGLLLYPYLSRVLSVENFGLFGFASSFVLIFQVIVEFGFMISATALISKHRSNSEKVSEIISATMIAKTWLSFASLALFLIVSFLTPMVKEHFLFVFLFFVNSVITAMMPDFFFRGTEQMKAVTIRAVTSKALSILAVIVLVRDDSQMLLIPVSMIIGNIVALFIALTIMKKHGVKIKRVQARSAVISIKSSLMFFVSRLATSVNSSLGSFFLGLQFSPASFEVGVFSGATKISTASEMMLPPVSDSIYPHMINKKDYRLFKKVFIIGIILWFFVMVFAGIFAELICTIVLGPEYAYAGNYLRVLLVGAFLAFPSQFLGYPALSPIGKAKHANIAMLVAAAINVLACLFLWATGNISLISVCIVVSCTNISSVIYRGTVLYKNRRLISQAEK